MLPRVDLIRAAEQDWLLMNSPDHITEFIKKNGFWGSTESTIAKVFLSGRENTHVVDAGANIGGFTLPISKYISDKNGLVFSFEPQRIVFQQLCANIFLNSLDNVHAYNFALSDTVKKIDIPELDFWKSQNIGGFSIDSEIRERIRDEASAGKNFSNKESIKNISVEQRTLDSFNFDFDVTLIKVDVEGYELEFFRGASHTIKKSIFPPIIFELWEGKAWYEKKATATKKILTDWGYTFNQFGREILAQHPAHPVTCIVEKFADSMNLRLVSNG